MDIFSLIALAKAKGSGGSGGGGGSENAVTYTAQSLTTNQKAQARENIGAGTYSVPSDGISFSTLNSSIQNSLNKADTAVTYNSQTIADFAKARARQNIGAAAASDLNNYATTSALASYASILDTKAEKTTIVSTSDNVIIMYPNRVYIVDHEVDMLGFVLRSLNEEYEEYSLIFSTSSSIAPNISLPSEVRMPEGTTFESNTRYEINIFDNCAAVGRWEK